MRFPILAGIIALAALGSHAEGLYSNSWVRTSPTGNLLYRHDEKGVRICDFSSCGYRSGVVELPNVDLAIPQGRQIFVYPAQGIGNDADNIQNALDAAAAMELTNGFRAMVYLMPGEYKVDRTVRITASGIVLKGSGTAEDTGTRVWATNHAEKYALFEIAGPAAFTFSPHINYFDQQLVPAGTRTFKLLDTTDLAVGNIIRITRHITSNWISAIYMDQLTQTICTPQGCTIIDPEDNWREHWIDYERQITRIDGKWVTVDSPLPQTFELQYSQGFVRRIETNRIENIGVEDLLLGSYYFVHPEYSFIDEKHAWWAVKISNAENAWVRRVVGKQFAMSTVSLGLDSRHVTVVECQYLEPKSLLKGGRRYSFHMEKGDHNLIRDCYANDGRHDYAFGSFVNGPNANVRCRATDVHADSGPHLKWSVGGLYDLIDVNGTGWAEFWELVGINVQNRGNNSSGHGWAGAYMTVWNCASPKFRVRNPPTARNWAIGGIGDIDGSQWWLQPIGPDPAGTYEWTGLYYDYFAPPGTVQPKQGLNGRHVDPYSLYFAQLQQRLKWPQSQFREYWIGDIDDFDELHLEDYAPVDADFMTEVEQVSGGLEVSRWFDKKDINRQIVFTFTVPLTGPEHVVAASLVLSMRAVGPSTPNDLLFLDSPTTGVPLRAGGYGWDIPNTGATVQTIEIDPAMLADGKLNVSIRQNVTLDWAVLHVQTSPLAFGTMALAPTDDTFVRGGSFQQQINGTNEFVRVKNEGDGDNSRRGYLTWRINDVARPIVGAKVRLFCEESGQPGNVYYAALTSGRWSEASLNWQNQPANAPPLAYFVAEPGKWAEFSVFPQVDAGTGSRLISLQIWAPYDLGDAGHAAFASKEHPDPTRRPQLVLQLRDDAPTMTQISNQTFSANTQLILSLQVADSETPAGSLVLTGTSSNPALIPNQNVRVTFGITSFTRVLRLIPLANQTGTADITLFLSDGVQTNSQKFTVRVGVPNVPPMISPIADQVLTEDITSPRIPFTIADAYGRAGNVQMTYSVSSSFSASREPPFHLIFGSDDDPAAPPGTNSQRYFIIVPAAERTATNTVTLLASDGFNTVSNSFKVTVVPVNDPPGPIHVKEPAEGETFVPGQPLPLEAGVVDRERDIIRVEFYHAGAFLGQDTNAPYQFTWNSPPPGNQRITAVAYDQSGQHTESPPVIFVIGDDFESPPFLAIAPEGNQLRLTWQTAGQNVQLQSSPHLAAGALWTNLNVAIPPNTNTVTIPRQGTGAFYRLIVVP